ncbi:MAG: hypothetical protein NVSMB33_08390 [Ktedonobacteraceae bacterium]
MWLPGIAELGIVIFTENAPLVSVVVVAITVVSKSMVMVSLELKPFPLTSIVVVGEALCGESVREAAGK